MATIIPYRLNELHEDGWKISYGAEVLNGNDRFSIERIGSIDNLCEQLAKVLDGRRQYEVVRTMPQLAEALHGEVMLATEEEYGQVVKWMGGLVG